MQSVERELEAAVLALPRGERARLAERLIASLDEESETREAWVVEVRRRLEAYREGEIESVSGEEAFEEARR